MMSIPYNALSLAAVAALVAMVAAVGAAQAQQVAPGGAQQRQAAAAKPAAIPKAATTAGAEKSGQTIVALVNDDPISAFDVEQRINLTMLSSGQINDYIQKNMQERWGRIAKDPKTNDDFAAFMKKKNPKSKEEAAVFQKEFAQSRQRAMVDDLRREARSKIKGSVQKDALEEIIEERLKLQEAKRLGIVVSDAEVSAAVLDIAKKNNKDEKEFGAMMAGMGINIQTMKDRFKASLAWRDVVRKQFGWQISIGTRDIDRAVSAVGEGAAAGVQTEFELHRITLAFAPKSNEKSKSARFAEADELRKKFTNCKTTSKLTAGIENAKFENLGTLPADKIAEPTRGVLQNAKAGEMLPPSMAPAGVELYAVCGRAEKSAASKKREDVQNELRAEQFELLARKHMKDLRQDAVIERRS